MTSLWKKDQKEYWRQWQQKKVDKKFGVSRPEKTKCAICRQVITRRKTPDNFRRIYLDHNHSTGKFRGWLCAECNSRLGWFERNTKRILKYLKGAK